MGDFEKLYSINVNDKAEDKEGLKYLSWAWAWAEFMKIHPDATYEVKKFEGGLPYTYDAKTGYMVYTSVTVDGLTREMWLPVMDSHNAAMKSEPYTVRTKWKEYTVLAATMFDINRAIMRCLTKNLAMFGLGLYIYAGEDLPDVGDDVVNAPVEGPGTDNVPPESEPKVGEAQLDQLVQFADAVGITGKQICATFKKDSLSDLTMKEWGHATMLLQKEADKKGIRFQ